MAPATEKKPRRKTGNRPTSMSLPEAAIAHVEEMAIEQGISRSAVVEQAIERMYAMNRRMAEARRVALEMLAEHEEEYGPIPQEVTDEVDAFLRGETTAV